MKTFINVKYKNEDDLAFGIDLDYLCGYEYNYGSRSLTLRVDDPNTSKGTTVLEDVSTEDFEKFKIDINKENK